MEFRLLIKCANYFTCSDALYLCVSYSHEAPWQEASGTLQRLGCWVLCRATGKEAELKSA